MQKFLNGLKYVTKRISLIYVILEILEYAHEKLTKFDTDKDTKITKKVEDETK